MRPPPVTSTLNRPPSPRNWNNIPRPNISPALYVIPESNPLPYSPSSFSPASPYIINHKRRGPRLLKSVTQSDVGGSRLPQPESEAKSAAPNDTYANVGDVDGQEIGEEQNGEVESNSIEVESNSIVVELHQVKPEDTHVDNGPVRSYELVRPGSLDLVRDKGINDFFDPIGSVSSYSNNELGRNPSTPSGEYFDAFEELARERRNKRKRRQRWIWSSIGLAATLFVAALARSYHPLSRSSSAGEGNATESH